MFQMLALVPLLAKLLLLEDPETPPAGGAPGENVPPVPPAQVPPVPNDKGFPEGTPLEQMTVDQQAAYWRYHSRKHEQRNQELLALGGGSVDGLKQKIEEADRLKQSSLTEQEKAVEEARKTAREEAIRESAGRSVDVYLRAMAAAGRITDDRADSLLDVIDRSKFLKDDLTVDTDKVIALIGTTPATGDGTAPRVPDLGQGNRPPLPKPTGREIGLAEAERRGFRKAAAAQ